MSTFLFQAAALCGNDSAREKIGRVANYAGRESRWKRISRSARSELEKGNNGKALLGYETALEELRKESPKSEEQYDLQLAIVELFRRFKRYDEAEGVLSRMEDVILHGKIADPLLACRFFRRRADLRESEGRKGLSNRDRLQVILVKERYFFRDAPTIINSTVRLLESIREERDWQTMLFLLAHWKKEIDSGTVPSKVLNSFKLTRELIYGHVYDLIDKEELRAASDLLRKLFEVDSDYSTQITLWDKYVTCCLGHKRIVDASFSIDTLHKILEKVKTSLPPSQEVTLSRRLNAHLALINVFTARRRTERVHSEWIAIREMLATRPSSILDLDEAITFCEAFIRVPVYLVKTGNKTDQVIEELRVAIQEGGIVIERCKNDPDKLGRMRQYDTRARFFMISTMIYRNRLKEAEQALKPLPLKKIQPNNFPRYSIRLARLYALLAEAYIASRKFEIAKPFFEVAKTILNKEERPPDSTKFDPSESMVTTIAKLKAAIDKAEAMQL
ncbi:MAG: hypothetical protein K2X93_23775 [Candidatus Obscuribacterales bacterium]|nr:hypothetical protein [Candidatus Obscuribacterales bacterium]